jgi:hypothetical protein
MADRRQRIHELVVALLSGRGDLELLEGESLSGAGGGAAGDTGGWLERNRRLVGRYQALVRSAVTIDALIDQEVGSRDLPDGP